MKKCRPAEKMVDISTACKIKFIKGTTVFFTYKDITESKSFAWTRLQSELQYF